MYLKEYGKYGWDEYKRHQKYTILLSRKCKQKEHKHKLVKLKKQQFHLNNSAENKGTYR